jgi:hypothetical protein
VTTGDITGIQDLYLVKSNGAWGNAEEVTLVCAGGGAVASEGLKHARGTGQAVVRYTPGGIRVIASGAWQLRVYDLRGKLAFTHRGHGQTGIALPSLGMNTYILSLEHDGTTKRWRFSLEGSR